MPCEALRRECSAARCTGQSPLPGFVFAHYLQDTASDDLVGALVVFHGRARARASRGVLAVRARLERVMGEAQRLH